MNPRRRRDASRLPLTGDLLDNKETILLLPFIEAFFAGGCGDTASGDFCVSDSSGYRPVVKAGAV